MLCWSFTILFKHDRFVVSTTHGKQEPLTLHDDLLDGIDIKDLYVEIFSSLILATYVGLTSTFSISYR